MNRLLFVFALGVFGLNEAAGSEMRIDDRAARATLEALGRPALTQAEALQVADLPANRAMVRKLNDLASPATHQTFADALVAARTGVRQNRFLASTGSATAG